MTAHEQLRKSVLLVLSSLLLIVIPISMSGQGEPGTVKKDPLTVYAKMSRDSDVVTTLAPGKSVQVTLTVTAGDGTWCSVSNVGSAERLGYVRCDGLDQQNDSSATEVLPGATLSTPAYQTSTRQTSINGTPSRAQKDWAIAASAMLVRINNEAVQTFSSGGSIVGIKRLLKNWWDISSRDELLHTLDWIDQGGHRQLFSELGARTTSLSPDQLLNVVGNLSSEDANSVIVAHRYYKKYATQSITAWDYVRYISLCRWGVAAGYISEEDAWPRVMHAAQILQQTFTTWSELGDNYLVGREFWSLSQTKIDGNVMRSNYQRLLSEPSSPWNRIPWNLPLEPPSSAIQEPPTPPSVSSSTANGSCDALQHAVASGQVLDVELILQTEPDLVNCRGLRGFTPLHTAADDDQTEVAEFLIAHGAEINARTDAGDTPLHWAAFDNRISTTTLLLAKGAELNPRDEDGNTPLHWAAARGHVEITELLISHGADLKARTRFGCTPLRGALDYHKTATVQVLLRHGATQ